MMNPNGARLSQYTGLPGWETVAEEELLIRYANRTTSGSIVEIGSEFGMSTAVWAKYSKLSVYAIDLETKYVAANLKEAGFCERVKLLEGDSRRFKHAHIFFPDLGDIGLLFIDGDHSYGGVLADLGRWAPRVRVGGNILLHDVAGPTNRDPHYSHYDVANAVAVWKKYSGKGFRFEESIDSTVVYTRIT